MNIALLSQVVEALPDPVVVFDAQLRLVTMNGAFTGETEKYLAITLKAGDSMLRLCDVAPHIKDDAIEHWQRALSGERFSYVVPFGQPPVHFKISYNPLYSDNN